MESYKVAIDGEVVFAITEDIKSDNNALVECEAISIQDLPSSFEERRFLLEKAEAEAYDCQLGICECCPGSAYYLA